MLHKFSPFHYRKGSNLWNPLGQSLTLHLEALEFEIEGFKNQKNRWLKPTPWEPPTKYEGSQLGPEVLFKIKNHRTTGENLPMVRSGGFRFGSIWSWSSMGRGGGFLVRGYTKLEPWGQRRSAGHTRGRGSSTNTLRAGGLVAAYWAAMAETWSLPSRPIPAWLPEILVLPCCKPL